MTQDLTGTQRNRHGTPHGFTAAVVERARHLATCELPVNVRTVAKQCLLDWFGVTIAGHSEPLVRCLVDQAREDGGKPATTVIGEREKFSVRQAALINGAMGHAIDFDDVNIAGHGHITAATLPAALAIAQARHSSGRQLLAAFIAGYEASVMVGRYVGRAHYDHGFHATVTVGSLGAAMASAVLLGLDNAGCARALGIAGTQAAGLKSQFGTMCKPFHAGKANENGVVGAQLAARGFTSRPDILECVQGFAGVLATGGDEAAGLAPARDGAHITDNLFKFTAACYSTHGTVALMRQLQQVHGFSADRVRRVLLRVEPAADRICNIPAPRTGLEAKFSLKFNAALALHGIDTSDPRNYADAMTARDDLRALRDRVVVQPMPTGWPVTVTEADIELHDGRLLSGRHDTGIPATDLKEQGERLLQKFIALTAPIVGEGTARRLSLAINEIEAVDQVSELMDGLKTHA
jgi:2-methylcitrate dehydratase PrpD